jgi:hypothetical protein
MATKPKKPPDSTRCTIAEAAKRLSSECGQKIEQAWLKADVKAGAPVNEDGTLNLLNYASWLLKQGITC